MKKWGKTLSAAAAVSEDLEEIDKSVGSQKKRNCNRQWNTKFLSVF